MRSENSHPLSETCIPSLKAIDDAFYVIGGKWRLKIIVSLFAGNTRFNEIRRTLAGISAKVLSHELRELELNGLVHRTVRDRASDMIEYTLTEYSQTLRTVVHALDKWGQGHLQKIKFRRSN